MQDFWDGGLVVIRRAWGGVIATLVSEVIATLVSED